MVQFKPMGPSHWEEIQKHLQLLWVEDTRGLVATDEEDNLLCAAVYDNLTGTSLQAHFLIIDLRPLAEGWMDLVHHYAFVELGVKAVYGLIPGNNEKALRFNTNLGFTIKCRMEEAYAPGIDYVVMELRAENRRYGKEKS